MKRSMILVLVLVAVLVVVNGVPISLAFQSPIPTPVPPGPGEVNWFQVILDWIVANKDLIAVVLGLIVTLYHDGMGRVKAFGTGAMLEAEKLAREEVSRDGKSKMEVVVGKVVAILPPGIKQVLVALAAIRGKSLDELIGELCQKWYDVAVPDLD